MPLVSVRENLWLKKHAGTAEPFGVARPKAVVLAINKQKRPNARSAYFCRTIYQQFSTVPAEGDWAKRP
jgi:hypothetical protein